MLWLKTDEVHAVGLAFNSIVQADTPQSLYTLQLTLTSFTSYQIIDHEGETNIHIFSLTQLYIDI